MKILLLQARVPGDPMLAHEQQCFESRCNREVATLNLAGVRPENWHLDADVLFVGGSGDFSVAHGGFDWEAPMLELMRTICKTKTPMLASCFGFQALAKAHGAAVVRDFGELGTHSISLTVEGASDEVFGQLPPHFDVNLGHNDSVLNLPDCMIHLAFNSTCKFQAFRVKEAPIWATQFHPELTAFDNKTRYYRYLTAYAPHFTPAEASEHAHKIHRETPVSNSIVGRFLNFVEAGSPR